MTRCLGMGEGLIVVILLAWREVKATTTTPEQHPTISTSTTDEGGEDGESGVRSDPGDDPRGAPCPASCFCEPEVGYASCVGDGQWAPPSLPPGLTRLELRSFVVPQLSKEQLHFSGLQELQLHQCKLTTIQDDAFASLAGLDRLDLSQNKLEALGPNTLRGLRALRHLDLSSNFFANLTRPFTHLLALEHLNLRENNLTRLTEDTFQGLEHVQYVNLDSNNITYVDVAAFQHLGNLAHLILSNNPLATLARLNFFGSRLQYIDISNIGITRVPQALTQFVRDLRLAKNAVREIRRGDLDSYPYLGLLVLDDNGLEVIEEDALGRHEYLARLWINGNKLTSVPQSLPTALRALYIEENLINSLQDGDFRGLVNTEQLFMQRNRIESIGVCAFCDLVNLKNLDLQANQIKNLTSQIFLKLSKLETLDLSQNPLVEVGADVFTGLSGVRVLQVSRVHTSVVPPETFFDPLKSLEILEMYGSPHLVAALVNSTRALHSLRGIRELNIMHNDVSALRPDFATFFPRLQVAKLSGNNWDCRDKKVLWLRTWMQKSPVHFYRSYNIRCSHPRSLGHKPIRLLQDTDFTTTTSTTSTTSTTPMMPITSTILTFTTATSSTTKITSTEPSSYLLTSATEMKSNATEGNEVAASYPNGLYPSSNLTYTDFSTSDAYAPYETGRDNEVFSSTEDSYFASNYVTDNDNHEEITEKVNDTHLDYTITIPTKTTEVPTELPIVTDTVGEDIVESSDRPITSSVEMFVTTPNSYTAYSQGVANETLKSLTTEATVTDKTLAPTFYWTVTKTSSYRDSTESPKTILKTTTPPYQYTSNPWHVRNDLTHRRDQVPIKSRVDNGWIGVGVGVVRRRHGTSDGAVIAAGVVAACLGVVLLVGGYALARGRSKRGRAVLWGSSSYWRSEGDDVVAVSVAGVGATGTGRVMETEGTVGIMTETHHGLNNRLYLLLQRDSTGITPDTLPDPTTSTTPDYDSPFPLWK